jgi:acyl carrier protein
MKNISDEIRQFILSNNLKGESGNNLHDDTPLQTSGLLDSLAVVGLIAYLEKHYKIQLTVKETNPEQFDRIKDIAELVARKMAA